MKKNTKRVMAGVLVLTIFAALFATTQMPFVYTGGWEAKAYMSNVVASGIRGQNAGDSKPYINNDETQSVIAGQSYTNTFDLLGRTTADVDVSSNEQVKWSGKATPSGSPDLYIEISNIRHSIINPLTGALLQTIDYHAYVEKYEVTYIGSDNQTHVWYGELHYYAFDIYIRTNAEVLNYGTLGWGVVHEGNVETSRGTAVSAIINTIFEVSPWVVVESTTMNFTFPDGTSRIGDYASGFAGILSATLWDEPQSGQVATTSTKTGKAVVDNCGGESRAQMSKGVAITMKDAQQTVNWKSVQIQGLPSKVTLEIRSGNFKAGAYKDPNTTVWDHITPTDYYVLYTNAVVQVLQQKDYILRTGYQQGIEPTDDKVGENISLWDQIATWFGGLRNFLTMIVIAAVILIGLYLVTKLRRKTIVMKK